MKTKKNLALVTCLALLAAYFLAQAFIPNFSLSFDYSLWLAIGFALWGLGSRSFLLVGIGGGFLGIYLQDYVSVSYATTPLFIGLVLIGALIDNLLPQKK